MRKTRAQILQRAFGYLRPHWHTAVGAYTTAFAVSVLSVVLPRVIGWIVDRGIIAQQTSLITRGIIFLLVLALIRSILGFLVGRWSEVASQNVAYDLRNAIHEKLNSLSFAYHDRAESGQLLSRSIQDVERIRFLTGRAVLRIFEAFMLLLATLIALLLIHPGLAVLALITTPLIGYLAYRFGSVYRPLSLEIQQQVAVLTTVIEQNLRGMRIVKGFGQEDAQIRWFRDENEKWFSLTEKAIRLEVSNVPLVDFLASLSVAVIMWYGGRLVINDNLTIGELVAFTTYMGQLVQPVRRLGVIVPAIAMAAASGERIFEILDAKSDVEESPNAQELDQIKGQVEFENVSFAYFGRKRVLKHVSFRAEPRTGHRTVGAMTGSGKSTIINMIPRFYDPDEGVVRIDGTDVRDVTLQSLRDQIGIVLQETTLFATTIRENIAFGDPHINEDAIVAAAKAAQAHDFILNMPDGYETAVGERGVSLSGGQKQRLAIARALLKDPRILLLDDATSSVDTATEQLIQQALEHLMEGPHFIRDRAAYEYRAYGGMSCLSWTKDKLLPAAHMKNSYKRPACTVKFITKT